MAKRSHIGRLPLMWRRRIRPFQSGQRIAYPAPGVINNRALTGGLSFVGGQTKSTSRSLVAASLSFIGVIKKQTLKFVTSVLLFNFSTGRFIITWYRIVVSGTPNPSPISPLIRTINYPITGSLSFIGQIIKSTSRVLVAGLSFIGVIKKQTQRTFSGSLAFVGAQSHQIAKILVAGLSFVGNTTKTLTRNISGNLSFVGTVTKLTRRTLVGGVLSFTGVFRKGTVYVLTGALSFVGTTQKQTLKSITATLSFIGFIGKGIGRAFTAGLSFVGSFIGVKAHIINFNAIMAAQGSINSIRWYIGVFKYVSKGMFRASYRGIRSIITRNRNVT